MTFCVECGAEGPILDGLCAKDFARRHVLVRFPETVDLVQCEHCGSVKADRGWVQAGVDDLVIDLLAARAVRHPRVERVRYTHDLRAQDDRTTAVTVKATCRVGPWDLLTSFHTTLRLQRGVCPTCSRQKGEYYVGTVQVRAEGRPLAEDEIRRAQELTDNADRTRGREEFVSRVEAVRGGIDVLVSTNAFGKRLAREIARALGGSVGSSATLHTRREGKDLYRATYVVRLPAFREGDVVEWRRARYIVRGLGNTVRLENQGTGEQVRVRLRELKSARVVRA